MRSWATGQKTWEIVDVDSDPKLSIRYGESVPVLFVNGRLFAKIRLPRMALRLRLLRAAKLGIEG